MKHTVLIVEDDPQNRKLLAELLAVKGYRIVEACDGRQGVEQAVAHLPELILMDIQLPKMDGVGALQALKDNRLTRAIPVWLLTAYAMPSDETRFRACGCDEYITKPLDLRDLLARIDRLFEATADAPACAGFCPGEPCP